MGKLLRQRCSVSRKQGCTIGMKAEVLHVRRVWPRVLAVMESTYMYPSSHVLNWPADAVIIPTRNYK